MKKLRFSVFLGVFSLLFVVLGPSSDGQVPPDQIPDRYIVQVQAGTAPAAVAAAHGLAADHVYTAAVNGFAGHIPPGRLQALQNDPRVVAIVPDRAVMAFVRPGDGGSGSTAQVVPQGVKRIGATPGNPALLGKTGLGVGVAIVDTGLDANHADLLPLGMDSFVATGSGTSAQDNNGHGTHVGGIVAARYNTIDVVGVAPEATLYAVKVLDAAGNGSDATVMAGLNWVAANHTAVVPNIYVVNMSLGRAGTLNDNSILRNAVQTLAQIGITVVVAAGNDCNLEVSQQVPATYPEVIAVASTTAITGTSADRRYTPVVADSASYFTTDGAYSDPSAGGTGIGVTISGPGEDQENIKKGALLQSVGILSLKLGGGTLRLSGTSMAAPHAAGVAALLYQQAGGLLNSDIVRSKIRSSADRAGVAPVDGRTACYSFDGLREGILSAPGALTP